MFRPAGYISLVEVWDEVGGEVFKRYKASGNADDFQGLSETTSWACWEFCRETVTARIVLPTGRLESFSPTKIRTSNGDFPINDFVDLRIGTVGSGQSQNLVKMREAYGEWLFCPIAFKENEFRKFLGQYFIGREIMGNSLKDIADRILRVLREDPSLNSTQVKLRAAPTVSHRQYQAARALARAEEPNISKGGQKKSKQP